MLLRKFQNGISEDLADVALGGQEICRAGRIKDVLISAVHAFFGIAVEQAFWCEAFDN